MTDSVWINEEDHGAALRTLLFGLALLAGEMAQADDPFAERLDELMAAFYRHIGVGK